MDSFICPKLWIQLTFLIKLYFKATGAGVVIWFLFLEGLLFRVKEFRFLCSYLLLVWR